MPLTFEEHNLQHQGGETAVLPEEMLVESGFDLASDWFDAQRLEYLRRWLES